MNRVADVGTTHQRLVATQRTTKFLPFQRNRVKKCYSFILDHSNQGKKQGNSSVPIPCSEENAISVSFHSQHCELRDFCIIIIILFIFEECSKGKVII